MGPEYMRAWRAANVPKIRVYQEKQRAKPGAKERASVYGRAYKLSKYGLTVEAYDAMVAEQGGVCRICLGPPTKPSNGLVVDHCHETGVVRGLLCGHCNTALGLLRDDPETIRRAAGYLENK